MEITAIKLMFDQIIVHLPYFLLRLIFLVVQGLEVCPSTPIHSCLIHVIDGKLMLASLQGSQEWDLELWWLLYLDEFS